MTYLTYDFDGFIELERHEMKRLKNGEKFLKVVRPAKENGFPRFGCPGDTLGAKETSNLRPQFNLRMVSNFFTNGQCIMVFARLN
ncbi:MAG: hypothetical protein AMJ53_11140 [Gammaproteobacteria bacterium SG8_11]|nr:MAG: hypothetical protein AMJ53_11140 [Gammaproteobacteria bacterium SG8_11]